MLMTAPASVLNSVIEQTEKLKSEILSSAHEPKVGCQIYYISPDGSDTDDGHSPDSAWKTLAALAEHKIEPGSEVLFERGGVWRGSFTASAGVTYSAYGDGDKPRIYGSPFDGAKVGEWVEVAPTIYRYSEKFCDDCGCIVMDGGAAHGLKLVVNYENEIAVDNITKAPFNGYIDLTTDLQFWHDLGEAAINDPDGGYIYLCSKEGHPAERFNEIEFLPRKNVIQIGGEGVTIDNLTIMYGGAHGIGSGTTKDLVVTNCVLGWIGGSLQYYRNGRPVRYGNGIEIYGGCDNYVIDHCYVYQIYDAGITHQLSSGGDGDCTMNHVRYTNNLIEYCTYSIEYFLGKPDRESAVRWMSDIDMRNNILRLTGYGWGDQRPDKTTAAHFKGWDHYNRLIGSFTIEDNIVECSRYMMIHCGTGDNSWNPTLCGNTFIQYADGQFGRYGEYPTEMLMYDEETLSNEEFDGNEFYSI
ncbi:MAG: right-handed parallel beta-helix repeat-containing protein [Clostridiales bacterium]|nr:right-handed parallel beta-helix repeat-containing protein [Clostridiales bacterium]